MASLDDDTLKHLKSLHTGAIDARNGYQEALKEAEGRRLTPLFAEMTRLHQSHADALAQRLAAAGATPDPSGSFMSTIHRTIMDVRALFNGLDESVLPGLIDGEKRNVTAYDEAINETRPPADLAGLLASQREDLVKKIAEMQVMKG